MAERELAILMTAKNMASGPVKAVTKDISTLDRVGSRAGKGIKTLGSNLRNLALGAGVGVLVGGLAAIKSGLESLAERENVISATNAAIQAQGKDAHVTAGQIRDWSEELERATGAAVDDKAIQASANTIIRTGAVSEESFKRVLAAAVDLGAGLKTGPEAGAKTLAIALADPVKGMTKLRRAGIILNEAEQKRIKDLVKGNKVQEAQTVLLAAVEKRYKGAAAASAGPYQRSLNLLADASEDAKMALAEGFLPIIEKVADRLSTALADKGTIQSIRDIGQAAAGFLDKAIDFGSQIPWGSIRDAMSMAGQGAKAIWGVFSGMPPWVQTAVLTGWGLNKLTGGAVGGIIGELSKGLIKGVLGMNAGVVNINAGVVNGSGGVPGVPGKGGPLALLPGALIATAIIAAAVPIGEAFASALPASWKGPNGAGESESQRRTREGREAMGIDKPRGAWETTRGPNIGRNRGDVRGVTGAREAATQTRAITDGLKPTADQITRSAAATTARQEAASRAAVAAALNQQRVDERGFASVVAAVDRISIPTPVVRVSAGDIQSRIGHRNRTVKPSGPRNAHAPGTGPLA